MVIAVAMSCYFAVLSVVVEAEGKQMAEKFQMNVRVTERQKYVLSKVLDILREDNSGERVEDLENWLAGFANLTNGDLEKVIAQRDERIFGIEERLARLERTLSEDRPN